MSNENETILIVSVGRTDLQLAVTYADDPESKHIPLKIPDSDSDEKLYQDFNQRLRNNEVHFGSEQDKDSTYWMDTLTDPDTKMASINTNGNLAKGMKLAFSEETPSLFEISTTTTKSVDITTELIANKLLPLVNQFIKDKHNITNIIVFNTHRENEKLEPFGVGYIIAQWLAKIFTQHSTQPLTFHEDFDTSRPDDLKYKVFCINYLKDKETFSKVGVNFPINRVGMQRINKVLFTLRNAYLGDNMSTSNPPVDIMCCVGGGIPPFKSQIQAACRFFFNNVKEAQNQRVDKPCTVNHIESIPSPSESYEARRQIIQLIHEGNFEGAAVVAQPFLNDNNNADKKVLAADANWAKAVDITAKWFQGSVSLASLNETLLQNNEQKMVLPYENESKMPNSLWSAFKIEAALRQKNLQDAIRYTCDLRDIALYDLIGKVLYKGNFNAPHLPTKETPQDVLNQATLEDFYKVINETPYRYKKGVKKDIELKDVFQPHQSKPPFNTRTKWQSQNASHNRMLIMDVVCYLDLPNEDYRKHPLNQFEDILKPRGGNGKNNEENPITYPRDYRNTITHGFLGKEKSALAKQRFTEDLWHHFGYQEKQINFLEQPFFIALFSRLDEENKPAQLYQALSQRLIDLLLNSPICDPDHHNSDNTTP